MHGKGFKNSFKVWQQAHPLKANLTAFLAFVGDDIDRFVLLTGRRVFFARDSGAQARAETRVARQDAKKAAPRKRRAGQTPIDCTKSEVPTCTEKASKTASKWAAGAPLRAHLTAFLAFVGHDIDGFVLHTDRRVFSRGTLGAQALAQTRVARQDANQKGRAQKTTRRSKADRLHHICGTNTRRKGVKNSIKVSSMRTFEGTFDGLPGACE